MIRKIFNIMVEMLQNISKNAADNDSSACEAPLFMIGESEGDYLLITSNKIMNEKIPPLKARLDEVNSLDADGLKKLYKEVRLSGSFSRVGGAGIGIIDMARKSGKELAYDFKDIDGENSFFSLVTSITRK